MQITKISQRQGAHEKHGGQDGRSAGQEIGASAGAKKTARAAAAKGRTHVGTLPCWIKIRPIIATAEIICTVRMTVTM